MLKTHNLDWLNLKSWKHRYEDYRIRRFLTKYLGVKVESYVIIGANKEHRFAWRVHGGYSPEIFDYINGVMSTHEKRN